MFKKFLFIPFIIFAAFPLFADSKNLVYSNTFDFVDIDCVEISLVYENLQVSRIYGDEIVVEIGSNNIKKVPEVSVDDYRLKIISKEEKVRLGDKCTVYIYLPQDFNAQEITINNVSGNISADILEAQNGVLINNVSGRTDINACKTELFTAISVSGNITLQKINADYFELASTSGNIFAQLEQASLATSQITNISGKTQLYYPKASDFEITAFTISGSIKDNSSNKTNTGISYHKTIGSGGSQLSITSVSGKVELVEF